MEDGVWRTIGGRRVFIKKGQSLSDAMKESGKFKTPEKKGDNELTPEEMVEYDKKARELDGKRRKKDWEKTDSEKQIEKDFPYNFGEEVEDEAHMLNVRGYDDMDDILEDFAESNGLTLTEAKYALLKDEFKTRQGLYIDAKEDGSFSDAELNHKESLARESYSKLLEAQEELDSFKKENDFERWKEDNNEKIASYYTQTYNKDLNNINDDVWNSIAKDIYDEEKLPEKINKEAREREFEKSINEGYEKFHGKTDKEIAEAKKPIENEKRLNELLEKQRNGEIKAWSDEDYELRDLKLQKRVDEGLITKEDAEYEKIKQAWTRDEISDDEFRKRKDELFKGKDKKERLQKEIDDYIGKNGEPDMTRSYDEFTEEMSEKYGIPEDRVSSKVAKTKKDYNKKAYNRGEKVEVPGYPDMEGKKPNKTYKASDLEKGKPYEIDMGNGIKKTAIYMGKDENGNSSFYDGEGVSGTFGFSDKFINEKLKISDNKDDDKFIQLHNEINKPKKTMNDAIRESVNSVKREQAVKNVKKGLPNLDDKTAREYVNKLEKISGDPAVNLRNADNWNDIHESIKNIKDNKIKNYLQKEAKELEDNENGAWKSGEYLAKQYRFYEQDKEKSKSMNDKIRDEAFKKYKKEHPGTKMTLKEFLKKK